MLDHKYKVFYHLAQTPNTTKVAEELLLSQPAISKNIKELEKELGITLFNRIKGRMQLTEAGQYLIFNPWDAHKPKAANGEPAPIKKVIVKIKED